MIHYKSAEEIELLRQSSLLVSKTHAVVAAEIKPGVSLAYLDSIAESFIRDNGGVPVFKGYNGFPATLCTSLNEAVVHGIPGDQILKEGDILSVDCGVIMNGFVGDSAFTFPIGEVSEEVAKLLSVTRESLYLGIEQAVAGNRIGDIGYAIQEYAERQHGYGIVRELVGHGVGRDLHEEPEVPNYGKRGQGPLLKEGMVIAIEPMINLGKRNVVQADDGWTIVTADQKQSAHFEHTIAVNKGAADVLSSFAPIDEAIKKNDEILDIVGKK